MIDNIEIESDKIENIIVVCRDEIVRLYMDALPMFNEVRELVEEYKQKQVERLDVYGKI